MNSNDNPVDRFKLLREKAEELLKKQPELASSPPTDMLDLIHELQINQTELEIQNEELKRSQEELSELYQKFENLYEFAPCGYITLDVKGIITQINLKAVQLLGDERKYLIHSGLHR